METKTDANGNLHVNVSKDEIDFNNGNLHVIIPKSVIDNLQKNAELIITLEGVTNSPLKKKE